MKKLISIIMIISMVLCFSACGAEEKTEYSQYKLSDYITFGDFSGITVSEPDVQITDEMIDERIEQRRAADYTENVVTEGTVNSGDVINIAFKGTLDDGTTQDGMSTESYDMVLGSGTMIPGFEEAMYGATIGEPVTAELTFPDPYENNLELSGRGVTFEITVNSKTEKILPELDAAFYEKDSEGKAKDEAAYREFIKGILYDEEYESQMTDIKTGIYNDIFQLAEIKECIPEEVEKEKQGLTDTYRNYASQSNVEWADFLEQQLGYTEEEFDQDAEMYAEQVVTEKMVIYALAEKAGVKVTEKDYEKELQRILEYYGMSDESQFQQSYGMTLQQYSEIYGVRLNLLLDMTLDKYYEEFSK